MTFMVLCLARYRCGFSWPVSRKRLHSPRARAPAQPAGGGSAGAPEKTEAQSATGFAPEDGNTN